MSRIKKEIEQYMVGLSETDAVFTSSFTFPAEFIGFQGHFPTKKVLPGACQIQCALTTIEKALKKQVALKEIAIAKYVAPVFPGDTLTCVASGVADTGNEFIYKARFTKGAEKVTELKLRVAIGDAV